MNENSKKGAIGEGISLEIGGLMQQDTEGAIEHIRENNTNTRDSGIDYVREIDKNKLGKSYKNYNLDLKKE